MTLLERIRKALDEAEEELKHATGIDDMDILYTWAADVLHEPARKIKRYPCEK